MNKRIEKKIIANHFRYYILHNVGANHLKKRDVRRLKKLRDWRVRNIHQILRALGYGHHPPLTPDMKSVWREWTKRLHVVYSVEKFLDDIIYRDKLFPVMHFSGKKAKKFWQFFFSKEA